MKNCYTSLLAPIVMLTLLPASFGEEQSRPGSDRVATVTSTSGCVAFWDFVKREPNGAHRFTAHVPAGAKNDFALDAGNYVRNYWGEGREATYADFPLLGRGPFGQAIRIRKETDATLRPFLFVPRARLHYSPIDLKGTGQSVTVVVWAIRESGNHALAGIWHHRPRDPQFAQRRLHWLDRRRGGVQSRAQRHRAHEARHYRKAGTGPNAVPLMKTITRATRSCPWPGTRR
jgi:hypothetical protein